jgi:hypothetical protein
MGLRWVWNRDIASSTWGGLVVGEDGEHGGLQRNQAVRLPGVLERFDRSIVALSGLKVLKIVIPHDDFHRAPRHRLLEERADEMIAPPDKSIARDRTWRIRWR